jgi:hypothetical protein
MNIYEPGDFPNSAIFYASYNSVRPYGGLYTKSSNQ